jgi:predicted ATP-grasp superfamily ATP-dependent carboligase
MDKVRHSKHSVSGALLNQRLIESGYTGDTILFGKANNKRLALETLLDNDLPIPDICYEEQEGYIGRPDTHSKGRWIYKYGDKQKKKHPATHYLKWIDATNEFRVHVVDDKVIKLQEKYPIGNFVEGISYFSYPHEFKHKRELRELAVAAVQALGLDFGAVDILYADQFYILEVNTAPCLTRSNDTLNKYVNAFMNRSNESANNELLFNYNSFRYSSYRMPPLTWF